LTYHQREKILMCHHCGYTATAPEVCPECGSRSIGFFGAGTERIEDELRELFPDTSVTRMDSDTTTAKDAHRAKLAGFKTQTGGILLGTQMIAKGLDFPDVTLVGIVNADTSLNLPDFRAGERTFQLMMQVGGRAGRGARPGHVVVQTYNPDSYAIQAMVAGDYDRFYEQEVTLRDALDYPPFSELINIGVSAADDATARELTQTVVDMIEAAREGGALHGVKELLGPAPAPLSKLKNRYRWHALLKTNGDIAVKRWLRDTYPKLAPRDGRGAATLVYDVDPLSLL
jgi:primosomal protein N' (replication factor Y) (superfamily II helicase)